MNYRIYKQSVCAVLSFVSIIQDVPFNLGLCALQTNIDVVASIAIRDVQTIHSPTLSDRHYCFVT